MWALVLLWIKHIAFRLCRIGLQVSMIWEGDTKTLIWFIWSHVFFIYFICFTVERCRNRHSVPPVTGAVLSTPVLNCCPLQDTQGQDRRGQERETVTLKNHIFVPISARTDKSRWLLYGNMTSIHCRQIKQVSKSIPWKYEEWRCVSLSHCRQELSSDMAFIISMDK